MGTWIFFSPAMIDGGTTVGSTVGIRSGWPDLGFDLKEPVQHAIGDVGACKAGVEFLRR